MQKMCAGQGKKMHSNKWCSRLVAINMRRSEALSTTLYRPRRRHVCGYFSGFCAYALPCTGYRGRLIPEASKRVSPLHGLPRRYSVIRYPVVSRVSVTSSRNIVVIASSPVYLSRKGSNKRPHTCTMQQQQLMMILVVNRGRITTTTVHLSYVCVSSPPRPDLSSWAPTYSSSVHRISWLWSYHLPCRRRGENRTWCSCRPLFFLRRGTY